MEKDPNVKIPKQVEEMAAGEEPVAEAVEAPVAEAPAAETPVEETPIAAVETPVAEAPPMEPPAPVEAGVPKEKLTLEQILAIEPHKLVAMYSTLHGKYLAEVPALTTRCETLQLKLDAAQTAPPAAQVPLNEVLNDEEKEELGPEIEAAVVKLVQSARVDAGPELQELRWQNFLNGLTQVCPTWNDIDTTAAFVAWMGETVPMVGKTRFELFDEAKAALDAPRCAEFYNTYLASIGEHVPAPTPADLAVPEPIAAPGAGIPAPQKGWKESEVKAFYDDVSKGRYRNSPKEAVRIEAEIDAAVAEGRIIKG